MPIHGETLARRLAELEAHVEQNMVDRGEAEAACEDHYNRGVDEGVRLVRKLIESHLEEIQDKHEGQLDREQRVSQSGALLWLDFCLCRGDHRA